MSKSIWNNSSRCWRQSWLREWKDPNCDKESSQMRDVIQGSWTETKELSVKLAFLKVSIIKNMEITCIIFLFCPDFRLTRYANSLSEIWMPTLTFFWTSCGWVPSWLPRTAKGLFYLAIICTCSGHNSY